MGIVSESKQGNIRTQLTLLAARNIEAVLLLTGKMFHISRGLNKFVLTCFSASILNTVGCMGRAYLQSDVSKRRLSRVPLSTFQSCVLTCFSTRCRRYLLLQMRLPLAFYIYIYIWAGIAQS